MITTFDYPGSGFANAPDVGMAYQLWAGFSKCKIFGIILDSEGNPGGSASTALVTVGGVMQVVNTWAGVSVVVSVTAASVEDDKILGVSKVTKTTNESGYFEFTDLVRGLVFTVSCPYFGKTVTVDTTGLDTIDLSTYF